MAKQQSNVNWCVTLSLFSLIQGCGIFIEEGDVSEALGYMAQREHANNLAAQTIRLKADGPDWLSANPFGSQGFNDVHMLVSGTRNQLDNNRNVQQYFGISPGLLGPGTAVFSGGFLESFDAQGLSFIFEPTLTGRPYIGQPWEAIFWDYVTNSDYLYFGSLPMRVSQRVNENSNRELGWNQYSFIIGSIPLAENLPRNITMYYDYAGAYARATLVAKWLSGTAKVGVEASFFGEGNYVDERYRFSSTGGINSPDQTQITFSGGLFSGIQLQGTNCDGRPACEADVVGFFAGPHAERAGMSYQIFTADRSEELNRGVIPFALRENAGGGGGSSGGGSTGGGSSGGGSVTLLDPPPTTPPGYVGPPLPDPDGYTTMRVLGAPSPSMAIGWVDSVTQNATTGALEGYVDGANTFSKGTATVAEAGGDALITWGRWTNGTDSSDSSGYTPKTYDANQGMHFVLGSMTPVAYFNTLTSGTATFTLSGATHPTYGDGATAPGTFSGNVAVAWGGVANTKIGVNFTVAMPDTTYNIVSTGGTANPATSEIVTNGMHPRFYGNIPMAGGRACGGSNCQASISGFFAGATAERAGLIYQIRSDGGTSTSVNGAAVFTR